MKFPFRILGLLTGVAVVPVAVEPFALRAALTVLCIGAAAGLAVRWTGEGVPAAPAADPDPPEATDHLIVEMRGAIEQTEQAVLEIGDRFQAISGRARAQLAGVTAILNRLSEQGVSEGAARERIEIVARETAALAEDINRIIVSLQFQDITRQRLERVIGRLQEMQERMAAARTVS